MLRSCLILCLFDVTYAFTWNSASVLPNGTAVPACSGQSVTLMWNYTASVADHLVNVEWHYRPEGGDDRVLATEVSGNLFLPPGVTLNVQFIPNAGIRLLDVGVSDSGTYSVHVNVNLHGAIVTEVQTVHVHVSDVPQLTEGVLQAVMLPDAVYDNTTSDFHIQLACGKFRSVWASKVSVHWTNPSNQTIQSSSYDNGNFLLTLPNPIATGEYTCAIDDTSPASLCVESNSPLRKGAKVLVDKMDARFAVLAGQMAEQQQDREQLRAELAEMLEREERMKQENEVLRSEISDLTAKLNAATQSVSFYASLSDSYAGYTHLNSGDRVRFTIMHNNNGDAYDNNGTFTAPLNGTYVFLVNVQLRSSTPTRHNVSVTIHVDGSEVETCYVAYDSYYDMGTCNIVLRLYAGQQVWLQVASPRGTKITLDAGQASAFSGALIHADY